MRLACLALIAFTAAAAQQVDWLNVSQFAVVGSGSTHALTAHIRNPQQGQTPVYTGMGTVILFVGIQRAYHNKMTKRTKLLLTVANFAASSLFAGYARSNTRFARQRLLKGNYEQQ